MSHDVEGAGSGSGFQESAEDLRDRARELLDVVGRLDGTADLLRRTLPRVADPQDDSDFRAACGSWRADWTRRPSTGSACW